MHNADADAHADAQNTHVMLHVTVVYSACIVCVAGVIPSNDDVATGMELKEMQGDTDIFWSREPISGHKGTKENPAIVPSFNDSRVVGLEVEQVRPGFPFLAFVPRH